METDKRVMAPIPYVYLFGLQNLRCNIPCYRANKTKVIDVNSIAYQCPLGKSRIDYLAKTYEHCSAHILLLRQASKLKTRSGSSLVEGDEQPD